MNAPHSTDDSGHTACTCSPCPVGPQAFPSTTIQLRRGLLIWNKNLLIHIPPYSPKVGLEARLHLTFNLKASTLGLLTLFLNLWEVSYLGMCSSHWQTCPLTFTIQYSVFILPEELAWSLLSDKVCFFLCPVQKPGVRLEAQSLHLDWLWLDVFVLSFTLILILCVHVII